MKEFFLSRNQLTIDDSTLWPNPKVTEFGNFKGNDEIFVTYEDLNFPELWTKSELLFNVNIVLSEESEIHERVRNKFITAIADLGGLYAVTMAIFAIVYWFFAEPYRDLHLAVSFNKMKNQICHQEKMIAQSSGIDEHYEAGLGFMFNLFLLLTKRVPFLIPAGDSILFR